MAAKLTDIMPKLDSQPFCTKKTSLMHSHWTWWWQPSWILPCLNSYTAILDSDFLRILSQDSLKNTCSRLVLIHLHKNTSLTLPFPLTCTKAAIFNSAFIGFSHFAKTLTQTYSIWLNTFILTEFDDGSHLESYHVGFGIILDSAILVFPFKLTHTFKEWFPPFAQKKLHSFFGSHHLHEKTSLIHSDWTWWWQPSWILPCWI